MGSLLRSEEMTYVRLYFDQVASHDTLAELARSEIIQLEDLNQEVSPFQREAAAEIRRCEEMLRRIRYLDEQSKSYKEDEHYRYGNKLEDTRIMSPKKLEDLDEFLCTMEDSVKEITTHEESIEESYKELNEMRLVLEACEDVFKDTNPRESGFVKSLVKQIGALTPTAANALRELSAESRTHSGKGLVNFVAGMIDTERRAAFERTAFRVTRGNSFVKSEDVSGGRTVFIVFLTGSKVRSKVDRTCTAFQAARYPIPEDSVEREKSHEACLERLRELELVITATKASRAEIIRNYRDYLDVWKDFVEDEKTILQASNMLNYDTSRSLFIAEGWVASTNMEEFTACVKRGQLSSNAQAPSLVEVRGEGKSQGEPPTYFRINKFTGVFQAIIESYGIAQYEEMNPAPFAVITFPFLFAVMFGDVGHGLIMACFSLILVIFERAFQNGPKRSEFFAYCFSGRYLIFLMGLLSIFTGFIYNEVFAVPMNIFVSRWKFTDESDMACGIDNCDEPGAANPPLKPYPFGFDPIWKISKNSLAMFNSYKMKLSIVLGVTHMILGIFNSFWNAVHFRESIDILFVFIPQFLFMCAIFGYLVLLILVKWMTDWNSVECKNDPNCQPPDLKAILIGMFMSPGHVPPENTLFRGQAVVQVILLLLALVCIPWMLLPRPLLLRRKHYHKIRYESLVPSSTTEEHQPGDTDDTVFVKKDHGAGDGDKPEQEFNFQDVFVGQLIHTIEFVLGAVSNTASYLRLWALSLAHSELSDVFLEKLIFSPLSSGNILIILIGFCMWIAATLGVLMGMESLSAFLHALRLHWVEFQNKFYNVHGTGQKFMPLTLKRSEEE